MPRDHARIQSAIWSDPDFRALPINAQHFYMLALSQPRLSYCGVLDYMPTRLAKFASNATPKSIAAAVGTLETNRFVAVDYDTEELLIRTFVRHDGLLVSPNVTKAMVKDYEAVLSDALKEVVRGELARAYQEDPSLKGWGGLSSASAELFRQIQSKGYRKGLANAS